MYRFVLLIAIAAFNSACFAQSNSTESGDSQVKAKSLAPALDWLPKGHEVALFAGGCFWCMEKPFDTIPGVKETIAGYTDGYVQNPTYQAVSRGLTGHTEAIQIVYDPKKVTYEQLLAVFWRNIDPVQSNGQFCDRGSQYRSGIYAYGEKQLQQATRTRSQLQTSRAWPTRIKTEIKAASRFYRAEEYHQNFYQKNPTHYMRYRKGCGRDRRLNELWGTRSGKE